jgi:hypothetical protein
MIDTRDGNVTYFILPHEEIFGMLQAGLVAVVGAF